MKGITCSEAKDILEKLNRLERLRLGAKPEMAEVCKEPEKSINLSANDFNEPIQVESYREGIFTWIFRFICKHYLIWYFAWGAFAAWGLSENMMDFFLYYFGWILGAGLLCFCVWGVVKMNRADLNDEITSTGILTEVFENKGYLPKGVTMSDYLTAKYIAQQKKKRR
jgi:hypothetical protein